MNILVENVGLREGRIDLRSVEYQTPEICLAAVKQNGLVNVCGVTQCVVNIVPWISGSSKIGRNIGGIIWILLD